MNRESNQRWIDKTCAKEIEATVAHKHIMRREKCQTLVVVMQGKIQRKKSVGGRRNSKLKNVRKWFGCSNDKLFKLRPQKCKSL